jgi:hypothetical protein
MKWIAAAAFATSAVSAQSNEEAAKEGAVMILSACAEFWTADTHQQVTEAYDKITEEFGVFAQRFDPTLKQAWDTYDAAKKAYAKAYDEATKSHEQAAVAAGEMLLRNLETQADQPEGAFDQWVDKAVGAGKTLEDTAKLGTALATDTESPQAMTEKAMKEARIAYLAARDASSIVYDMMIPVMSCAYDQKVYLDGKGEFEDSNAQPEDPPPLLVAIKPMAGDAPARRIGFSDAADNVFELPQPEADADGRRPPDWPELCRDACMADSQCVAWNYIQPEPADPLPPAQCEIFKSGNASFQGLAKRDPRYSSGWGPAAVEKGFALPKE